MHLGSTFLYVGMCT